MERSVLLSLHEAAGARIGTEGGTATAVTFGDVPGEYRAGMQACALFDETDRGRIEVRGEEAAPFLHRLLSSDVRGVAPGAGQRSLLLSSKGKVLFDFDLFRAEDHVWLSVPPGRTGALLAALDTYLFGEKVTLSDTSSGHAPLALCGPRAADVLRSATGIEPPSTDHAWRREPRDSSAPVVARLPIAGSPGFRVDAGPDEAPRLWKRLREAGAVPAGIAARDILRIEAGQALHGVDVDENVYPQEARLETAFSLTKGCFIGQEVVAKIDTYGGLNKRLVALKLSQDDPVAHGTRVFQEVEGERRDLGVVTSWAYSFVLDTGLALAYVKRRHQEVGTKFQIGDTGATGEIVPLPVRTGAVPIGGELE